MTKEQRALLTILRHGIDPNTTLPEADFCDWAAVLAEARQQAVSLFAYEVISGMKDRLPEEVVKDLSDYGMRRIARNMAVMNSQRKLAAIMKDRPYVILKGEAAAAYYPKPELRSLGDVDFLVEKQTYAHLHELFTQMGFSSPEHQNDHHTTYRTPTGVLEMHYEPPGIPTGAQEGPVREYLADLLSTRQTRESAFGSFPVPEDRLHGLILLLHMQHHMLGEGIGLRHLMDWGCFVAATAEKPFWEESLLPLLKKVGLFTYCAVMTKTCALQLGTPCPCWAQDADEALCDEVLADILEGGNFGRKDTLRATSAHMVSDSGKSGTKRSKLGNLWAVFHRSVAARYPVVKKYPVLYLVFYPIKAVRYIFLMLTGKRGSLAKALPQATVRRQLYGKLHIFEETKNG